WVEPNVILSAFKGQREVKFSEFFYVFYRLYFDDYAAKPLIIKDPHLVQNLDMAKKVFCRSEVRVVHLIRDPRAVAKSYKARWKNHSALSASIAWRDAVRSGRRWSRNNSPSYLEIRYEDLVTDPENTISQVCDFLSVQYHSCLMDLNYNVDTWNVDGKGEATNTNFKGFDASKLDNWRSHLTAVDIAIIERTCRSEMPNYGYPLVNAQPNAAKFAMRYNKEMLTHTKSELGKSLYSSKNRVGKFLRRALRGRPQHPQRDSGK
ncbi:sulfotransferase, partial [Mariniblastus sp.]|nr:sulfotransferase [Mariniblastus sp.]